MHTPNNIDLCWVGFDFLLIGVGGSDLMSEQLAIFWGVGGGGRGYVPKLYFLWGVLLVSWGLVFLKFFLNLFFNFHFHFSLTFFVLCWNFIIVFVQHSFIHTSFFVYWGKCKCWTPSFFCLFLANKCS